jgi:uncharacterized OB-fold protein
MRWISVYYKELRDEQHPGTEQGTEALFTDLECSDCGHHIFPPQPKPHCPRCGQENES